MIEKENKPSTDPSEQNVSSEEGKDVTSQKTEQPKPVLENQEDELDKEIREAVEKIQDGDKKEETKETKETEVKEDEKKQTEQEIKKEVAELSLEEINKIAGREFESKEDFLKHYKNLSSFVGDEEVKQLREKAKNYDEMIKDAGEIEKLLNKDKKEEKPSDKKEEIKDNELEKKISTTDQEVIKIKTELAQEKFLKKHPDAESYLSIISAVADKENKELEEVYKGSDLESLIADKKALQEVKSNEKDLGVNSKGRLAPSRTQKITDLTKQLIIARKDGKARDVDSIKQKLVEETLGQALQ